MGFWALAGCGGGSSGSGSSATSFSSAAGSTTALPLSAATLASIRARPEFFLSTYGALGGSGTSAAYVQSRLGASFAGMSDAGCLATFAALVAFKCAPAGANPIVNQTATMRQLLDSQALNCGHYCKLTTLFTLLGHPEVIPPDAPAAAAPQATLHFLIWLVDVPLKTGLHSQLIISNVLEDAYLLLDPMYAYALRIPFVGAGPQASLSVVENAVTMMQTPIAQNNLVVLDPAGPATLPDTLSVLTNGTLGPQYIYHDSFWGCEGWDTTISQIFNGMGLTASTRRIPPHP
jgi:hypothetical protein